MVYRSAIEPDHRNKVMSVQFPYRAVICGEEHIVKGWRGRKLLTDKGSFSVRHLYGDWQIQATRLLEVALLQSDGNGGWLLNGKALSLLESLPMGVRFADIPSDENLRVHKGKIYAVAWVQTDNSGSVTELLDLALNFWNEASLPVTKSNQEPTFADAFREVRHVLKFRTVFAAWSKPIWLTEFRHADQKLPISPQQKQLARVATELDETKAQLRKAEAVANDTLKEALTKWMKFDPPGMSADTKARIEKAVKLYVTDSEKRSLQKVADEFGVSRKTVSVWFSKFKKETGYPVVTQLRHESVREHVKAESEQNEDD